MPQTSNALDAFVIVAIAPSASHPFRCLGDACAYTLSRQQDL
ncbi:hypothetical protein [Nostoc commune]|nr:hypothetical protein [Nostoc commune]